MSMPREIDVHALESLLTTATPAPLLLDVREPWEQALWIVLSAAFVGLGLWVRIVKPLLRRRRLASSLRRLRG